MEFFKQNTRINFMAQRKGAAIISTILFVLSIVSFCIYGLNWGLDFTGGAQIQLHFANEANLNQIRDALQGAGFKEMQVMNYGTSKDVLVKIPTGQQMGGEIDKEAIVKQITQVLPELEGPSYESYFVYPEELRNSKRIAVFRDFLIRKVSEAQF